MSTVAELLGGSSNAAAGSPAPPPGFVPANDAAPPPPPPGFVPVEQAHGSGLLKNAAAGVGEMVTGTAGSIADYLNPLKAVFGNMSPEQRTALSQAFGKDHPILAAMADPTHALNQSLGVGNPENVKAVTPAEKTVRTAAGWTAGALVPGGDEVTVANLLRRGVSGLTGGVVAAKTDEALKDAPAPVRQAADIATGLAAALLTHKAVTPKTLARTVSEAPRETFVDPEGDLTQEGREAVIRHEVSPKEVRAAIEPAPQAEEAAIPAEVPAPADPAAAPVAPQEVAGAEIAPEALTVPPSPELAAQRVAEAQSEGVDLSKGQATQDYDTQVQENNLRASPGQEGTQARLIGQGQQQQITAMVDNFKSAVGDTSGTAADRGQVVQGAITHLRDQGQAGVRALYEQAKDLPGSDKPLNPGGILDAADKLILETPMEQGSKDALERAMAKYGVLPGEVQSNGRYASVVTDDGRNIRVLGKVEPLTLSNAEDFRQALNAAWDQNGLMGRAIKALDDVVDDTIANGEASEKTAAFKAARQAAKTQNETFKGKDVVSDIAAMRAGTRTPKLDPEDVVKKVLGGGKDNITDLRRLKAVLLSNATDETRAAWQALQSHAVGEIFDKAISPNGEFSGARLTSAIKQFGPAKLKLLLGETEFNHLMKVNRIMRNATVSLTNTTNPSGSGYAVIRFLTSHTLKLGGTALRLIPGVGHLVDMASGVAKIGRDTRVAEKTLEGMRSYTAEQAAKDAQPKSNPAEFAREFLDVTRSKDLLAPILAVEAQPQGRRQ